MIGGRSWTGRLAFRNLLCTLTSGFVLRSPIGSAQQVRGTSSVCVACIPYYLLNVRMWNRPHVMLPILIIVIIHSQPHNLICTNRFWITFAYIFMFTICKIHIHLLLYLWMCCLLWYCILWRVMEWCGTQRARVMLAIINSYSRLDRSPLPRHFRIKVRNGWIE